MRIGSKPLENKNTKTVKFYRGDEEISLVVGPLPPKYLDRLRDKVLVIPNAPKKAVEERPGKYLKENGKVIFEEDTKDPKYRAELDSFLNIVTTARLVAYLGHDSTIQFDVPKPTVGYDEAPEVWREYFRNLFTEITDPTTGFTSAEISHIMEAGESTELNLGVDEAMRTF